MLDERRRCNAVLLWRFCSAGDIRATIFSRRLPRLFLPYFLSASCAFFCSAFFIAYEKLYSCVVPLFWCLTTSRSH